MAHRQAARDTRRHAHGHTCLVGGQSFDDAPDGIFAASEVGLDGFPHSSSHTPRGIYHLKCPHSRHVLLDDVSCRGSCAVSS